MRAYYNYFNNETQNNFGVRDHLLFPFSGSTPEAEVSSSY